MWHNARRCRQHVVDNAGNNYQGATMRLVVGGACVIVLICDSTQFTHGSVCPRNAARLSTLGWLHCTGQMAYQSRYRIAVDRLKYETHSRP